METKPPFISRVVIKNYKSIARCDVRLGALQFLVGRNGSGKSNFLDALAFVRDMIVFSNVAEVLQSRMDVLHRKDFTLAGSGRTFSISLECNLPDGAVGVLDVVIDALESVVEREKCVIKKDGVQTAYYETRGRKLLDGPFPNAPPPPTDRLYLQTFGSDAYRPLHDGLRQMQIYRLDAGEMTKFMPARSGVFSLNNSGDNLNAVLHSQPQEIRDRINEYMRIVVPSFRGVGVKQLPGADRMLLLEFLMSGEGHSSSFHAQSMSDGTLRALGVLTALLQKRGNGGENYPSLVGIEEPETGLHACAFGALLGALQEASDMRQVIVATHSADMLDDKDVAPEQILPVEMRGAETVIAPLRDMEKGMLRDHLTTGGELLRQDMLPPDADMSAAEKPAIFLGN